jgi:non-ribosomal peptide synthetase component F/thioesterase domain-containing protein
MTSPLPSEERKVLLADLSSDRSAKENEDLFAFMLSPIQYRIWRAYCQAPTSTVYNASFRWNLEGPVQPVLVEESFRQIIDRHEILRTTFTDANGRPEQVVVAHSPLRISQTDLRDLPQGERMAEMDRLCAMEAQTPFDLRSGPLLRVGLLRLDAEHFVLMLTLHHIVTDGWSIGILMEELKEIYASLASGREPALAPLAIQFGDYVEWQKTAIEAPAVQSQLEYWKTKLQGYQPLEMPTDYPRSDAYSTASNIVSEMLPRDFTDRLKAFAGEDGATMFSTTLAACTLLVSQLTGASDVSIGSTLAGRTRPELESLAGVFINGVILRNQVSGNPTFQQFAADIRTTVWETFANQDIPFETVLDTLRPGEKYESLFPRVNFICQREYARASTFVFEFAGIRMSTMPSKSQGALYDLNFFMVEREAGWRLSLEYRSDLYSFETSRALLEHFKAILSVIATDPDRRLSDFPHLDLSILHGGKDSSVNLPGPVAYLSEEKDPLKSPPEIYAMPASHAQERFWMLAGLSPDNPAFNMAACMRLSGALSAATLEKSLQTLVNRHEALRTTFKSESGQLLQVIRTEQGFTLRVQEAESKPEIPREIVIERLVREEAELPFNLEEGPLFRANLLRFSADDHVLVLTIHHILADGWSIQILERELWTVYEALRAGKEVSLPPLVIQYSDFAEWQKNWLDSEEAREHLDFWTQTLSGTLPVIHFPTDRAPANRPASHGAIETQLIPPNLAASIKSLARSNNVTAFALTLSCFAALLSRYSDQQDLIIGSPVANRRPETEPVIGPFAGPFALRLDLSGDPSLEQLLRRVQNVSMDALSHTELPFEILFDKLKVRSVHGRNPLFQFYFFYQTAFLQPQQLDGLTVSPLPSFSIGTPFEIQFGLVERAEGVRAQVEYNPDLFDASSIQALLAYYIEILRALVAEPLQSLSKLPLPPQHPEQLSGSSLIAEEEVVAPRSLVEEKLQIIWQQSLDQPNVRISDSFFDLGGNSLLAARMLAKVEQQFGVKIKLNALLQFPTIAKLATLIEHPPEQSPAHQIVTIKSSGTRSPIYWIPGGRAVSVLGLREVSLALGTDQPVYGLESRLPEKDEKFPTVPERAAAYLQLIRNMQPHGPYCLIGYCTGGMVAFEMAQQLRAMGEVVGFLGLVQAGVPGFYSKRSTQFRADFEKKRYLLTVVSKFFLHRVAPGLPGVTKNDRQLVRDRVAALMQGWISSSAQLPDETQSTNEQKMKKYRPAPYPGRASLYLAEGCFESAGIPPELDSRMGWNKFILGGSDIHKVHGDHYSILSGNDARMLAAALKSSLDDQLGRE